VISEAPAPDARAAGVLRTAPLFAALAPAVIDALAAAATRADYGAQAIVFFMGAHDDALYVVESGWLKAMKSAASGREQTIATFGPGAILNDVAVLAGAPNQATVIALEPTTLWRIPRTHILTLIDHYPPLAHALIRSLASRVMHLAGLVEDLALRPVEARLARLILTQAHHGRIVRRHWATQAELAAQVGTVPDVLNRALRSLVDAGLIAVERRTIRILDAAGLEARAQLT
jgi:CRP/FNR family transcriptional regulator